MDNNIGRGTVALLRESRLSGVVLLLGFAMIVGMTDAPPTGKWV
jgi:hypothetical protein